MAMEQNIISFIKPSVDEIINMVLQFPVRDQRREQLWSLIIKDEDLTKQIVAGFKKGNNATVYIPR